MRRALALTAGRPGRAIVSAAALVIITWVARGRGLELLAFAAAGMEIAFAFILALITLLIAAGAAGAVESTKGAEDA